MPFEQRQGTAEHGCCTYTWELKPSGIINIKPGGKNFIAKLLKGDTEDAAQQRVEEKLGRLLCVTNGSGAYHSTIGELSCSWLPARAAHIRTTLICGLSCRQVRQLGVAQM